MTYDFEPSGKLKPVTAAELAAADADSAVIMLDRGIAEDGRPYWLYIAVRPSKCQEFIEATREGRLVQFEEFGTILEYGYEREVPAAVRDDMKQRYDCDDNYMELLRQDIHNARVAFFRAQEDRRIADIVAMLKATQDDG